MNPLVKKEIHLLLPGFLAVLLLEAVQPWFWNDRDYYLVTPVIFFFGMTILAVDSFGREFSLGTFQSLLAQPMERRQIWRTKTAILFFGAALIFAVYFASWQLRLHEGMENPSWYNSALTENNFRFAPLGSGVALLVALVGGLWTTLLLRQIAAAFWITFLAPGALLMLVVFFLPAKFFENEYVLFPLLFSMAGAYVVSGFWLAHRLFHRAQDAAWTGGIISFSTWRYFEAGSKSSISTRDWKPFSALLKKEFQLQSITFFCGAALLVLHLGIFVLRFFYAEYHKNSITDLISEVFWMLWLVMPLVIGGTAVAEERKLGVAEQQFCLPVSRRALFAGKFIPTMIFGVLLGGVMPLLLETLAAHLGAPSEMFKPQDREGGMFLSGDMLFPIYIMTVAVGLTLIAIFASTLVKNFLQALSFSILTIVGCCLLASIVGYLSRQNSTLGDIMLWPLPLLFVIAVPSMAVACLWLAYRNFSNFHETGRLWRRNLLGIAGALLFAFVSSAMIYNRVWEVFVPAEPPHGAAKLSLANPPAFISGYYDNLQVRLPDGRVCFDYLRFPFDDDSGTTRLKGLLLSLQDPLPKSVGVPRYVTGSNWLSATVQRVNFESSKMNTNSQGNIHVMGYLDVVGVKSDGTLWVSDASKDGAWAGDKMNRFGNATNWQQLVRSRLEVLLLKNDGTLWRWGTNNLDWSQRQTNWPSLHQYEPYQIGMESGWKEIWGNPWNNLARKTDGSVWGLRAYDLSYSMSRGTNLDQASLRTLSESGNGEMAYVRPDGTLWMSWIIGEQNGQNVYSVFVRVGMETNWTAVAMNARRMVALKSDGSLWQWQWPFLNQWSFSQEQINLAAQTPPTRLGIHNDWVAITKTWQDVIALAADGSLWLWPNRYEYEQETLLKLPKQPKFLGNVFSKSD